MKYKKYWPAAGGVVVLVGAFFLCRFLFSSTGKNFMHSGAATIVEAWKGVLDGVAGGSGTRAVALDDVSSSVSDISAPDDLLDTDTIPAGDESSAKDLSTPPASTKRSSDNALPTVPKSIDHEPPSSSAHMNLSDGASAEVQHASDAVPSSDESAAPRTPCTFSSSTLSSSPSRTIIVNEIAWMGSVAAPGESSADAAKKEWVEIKNISGQVVDLFGWRIADASGKFSIDMNDHYSLSHGNFFLMARASTTTPFSAQKFFSNGLVNSGDTIVLFDPACGVSDVLDASRGWPGGDNDTKRTLERDANGFGWHTSSAPGGTPGAENSIPVAEAATSSANVATSSPMFDLTIAFGGDGSGTIHAAPQGIVCGLSCKGTYASGTIVALTPTANASSTFAGWSGPCFGTTTCTLSIDENEFITATFRTTNPASLVEDAASTTAPTTVPEPEDPTSTVTGQSEPSSTVGSDPASTHLLIAAVQIGGASSTNDFVKLYDPTAASVDLGGYKLRKRAKTGAESSLRELPQGSSIAPGAYFTWANSSGGFSASLNADVSSSETLAVDNSVALVDANGSVIDAVAWGAGAGQYVEGSPFPDEPTAGAVLARRVVNGVMVDTDNNASDFAL